MQTRLFKNPARRIASQNFQIFAWILFGFQVLVSVETGVKGADLNSSVVWNRIAPFFIPPAEYSKDFGTYKTPMEFADGSRVKSAEDWNRRRNEIVSEWNQILGNWPALIQQPQIDFLAEEIRENFLQHRVRVEIAPGQKELGYLLIPNGAGPFPAVVVPFYEPETSIGRKGELRDFALQLARRGYVTLSIGSPGGDARQPVIGKAQCQPLAFLGYVAANCHTVLAHLPKVDPRRIGIVGHSYGGKWAMFGSCFYDKFACAVWSDPGIVFDEARPNVNYWEPWYLGFDTHQTRKPGLLTETNPRTGPYRTLIETGHDLHEIHALMAPRPFLVSGGSEDQPERWPALNHAIEVNRLLGYTHRVAMTNRKGHSPTVESNEQIYLFFDYFLKE